MKDYEEELKDTKDVSDENEHKDDYEDVCYLCRRPESKAGKLIHLPMEGICICPDCMQRSFTMMSNSNINYDDLMRNMNLQDMFPGNLQDGIPKSQRLKKKKTQEKRSRPLI